MLGLQEESRTGEGPLQVWLCLLPQTPTRGGSRLQLRLREGPLIEASEGKPLDSAPEDGENVLKLDRASNFNDLIDCRWTTDHVQYTRRRRCADARLIHIAPLLHSMHQGDYSAVTATRCVLIKAKRDRTLILPNRQKVTSTYLCFDC